MNEDKDGNRYSKELDEFIHFAFDDLVEIAGTNHRLFEELYYDRKTHLGRYVPRINKPTDQQAVLLPFQSTNFWPMSTRHQSYFAVLVISFITESMIFARVCYPHPVQTHLCALFGHLPASEWLPGQNPKPPQTVSVSQEIHT